MTQKVLCSLQALLVLCFLVFSCYAQLGPIPTNRFGLGSQMIQQQLANSKINNTIDVASSMKPIPGKFITPSCYVVQGRESCAPSFIVAGSMKCGTTSMYSYLQNHPSVISIPEKASLDGVPVLALKEVRYFLDPVYSKLFKKYGQLGSLNQYLNLFSSIPIPQPNDDIIITGEASPMYVCQPEVAQRIKYSLPKVKIIIMLRNPVDRAYSEFWFRQFLSKQTPVEPLLQENWFTQVKQAFEVCAAKEIAQYEFCNATDLISLPDGQEKLDLCLRKLVSSTKGICAVEPDSKFCVKPNIQKFCTPANIKNGLYVLQLINWLASFNRDQLLFIKSEDFYHSTPEQMNRVTKFLGLDPFDWDNVASYAYNIVSAGTASAVNHEITSQNSKGLLVGKTDNENTSHYPPLEPEVRTKLSEFFRPYNEALEEITGLSWE